jgi:predicted NBD/HSP70 family sugar kinase
MVSHVVKGPHAWTAGELLQLVRQQRAASRSELARLAGMSPSTIAARLESLLDHGYLIEDGEQSDRGRKPRALSLNPARGIVVGVDIGSKHTRIGVTDMTGTLRFVTEHETTRRSNAAEYLTWLESQIGAALGELVTRDGSAPELRGIGLSIPSPVDRDTRQLIHPLHLPEWNSTDPASQLASAFGVPVIADNDATLMALGEHRMNYPDVDDMLYIKLGSAIGCGIIASGNLYRGRSGGAGEIGHMPVVADGFARRCRCGRDDCVEARFGGAALVEHLVAAGISQKNASDFVRLADLGQPNALEVFRAAGHAIGEVIGTLCNIVNPELVVLGGKLSQVEPLTHALRSALYARTLPLPTRELTVSVSQNGANASILGAAWQVLDLLLSVERVNEDIQAVR